MSQIRIALIGFGKIARDQHVPAIRADRRYELVAVTSRSGDPGIGVAAYADLDALLGAIPHGLDAVAICTPPDVRHALARRATAAGLAVLLEKPPAATLGELGDLVKFATRSNLALYAGWHSQHAPAVATAAAALQGASVTHLDIIWHEDVRKWHPGQDWVWDAAGFGVFDPGINALSIATRILPEPLLVQAGTLQIPANRQSPIAARLTFAGASHHASFDWRQTDGETWSITIKTADGRRMLLLDGGARLLIDGVPQPVSGLGEYASIYDRFADCIAQARCEVDAEPLRIVADAFLIAQRSAVPPFIWNGKV